MPFHAKEKLKEMRHKMVSAAHKATQEQLSGPDQQVVKAVQSGKNVESIFNLVFEQTMEWYSLHYPELRHQVKDPLQYLQLIAQIGDRKHFTKESVAKILAHEVQMDKVVAEAHTSRGGTLDAHALKAVQSMAHLGIQMKHEQLELQGFVEAQMRELAPNFSELGTPFIAAQLLAKAGSLKRLSEMTGSTIQVLGAEEALFSHLKSHTRPPKHGYIFNHPLIKTLPKHVRGKMARTLAGKLAICVRTDVFGKTRIVDELKSKMEAYAKRLAKLPFKPKARGPSPYNNTPRPVHNSAYSAPTHRGTKPYNAPAPRHDAAPHHEPAVRHEPMRFPPAPQGQVRRPLRR